MVAFAVFESGVKLSLWKGESMENSSWTTSEEAGVKGTRWVLEYSEISIWND